MIVTGNRYSTPQKMALKAQNNRNNVAFGKCYPEYKPSVGFIAIPVCLAAGLATFAGLSCLSQNNLEKQITEKAPKTSGKLIGQVDSLRSEIMKTNTARRPTDKERYLQGVVDSLNGKNIKPLTGMNKELTAYRAIDSLTNVINSAWAKSSKSIKLF